MLCLLSEPNLCLLSWLFYILSTKLHTGIGNGGCKHFSICRSSFILTLLPAPLWRPSHSLQFIRSRLLQHGSPTGCGSSRTTCSGMGSSVWAAIHDRSLLQSRLSMFTWFFWEHLPAVVWRFLGATMWMSLPVMSFMGCRR